MLPRARCCWRGDRGHTSAGGSVRCFRAERAAAGTASDRLRLGSRQRAAQRGRCAGAGAEFRSCGGVRCGQTAVPSRLRCALCDKAAGAAVAPGVRQWPRGCRGPGALFALHSREDSGWRPPCQRPPVPPHIGLGSGSPAVTKQEGMSMWTNVNHRLMNF